MHKGEGKRSKRDVDQYLENIILYISMYILNINDGLMCTILKLVYLIIATGSKKTMIMMWQHPYALQVLA